MLRISFPAICQPCLLLRFAWFSIYRGLNRFANEKGYCPFRLLPFLRNKVISPQLLRIIGAILIASTEISESSRLEHSEQFALNHKFIKVVHKLRNEFLLRGLRQVWNL
jgi:hypothetical protein